MKRRVALTGRGIVSPLGVGLDEYWRELVENRCAVAPVDRLVALGLGASRAGQVRAEAVQHLSARLPRKQQKLYNRPTLLAMLAASLAMEDAGLTQGAVDPERLGVLLGVNALSMELAAMTEYVRASESATAPGTLDMALANTYCMRNINPLDYSLKTLPNLAAGHLAIAHDAQGACRAMTDGPLGGLHAVGQAASMIREGDLDVALSGGADAQLDELVFATHEGAGLLVGDAGEGSGLVLGEGSAILVLEDAERARARGARVHAEVLAFAGSAGDGELSRVGEERRLTERLVQVIDEVLDEAGAAPDLVAVHGAGPFPSASAAGAALEVGLTRRRARTARACFDRAHGDLGAAGGAIALLGCSAILEHGMIPAVVLDDAGPGFAQRRALVVSLGLFGESAAVMLGGVPS